MKNRWIFLLLTPALALSLTACQSEVNAKKSAAANEGISLEDRNDFIDQYGGDQKLSKAEFDKARSVLFGEADTNHDGIVDEQEYVNDYAARLEKQINEERKVQVNQTVIRFAAVDENSDGKIVFSEFKDSGEILFTYLDEKETGVINRKTPEPEEDGNVDRSVIAMPSTHSVKGFLEIYDLDGNGEVTRSEFDAERKTKFELTDTNHDGWLNADEYQIEFENRLDQQAKKVRATQIKQAHLSFATLDADKNSQVTVQEFNLAGNNIFNKWDLNNDGWVNNNDPLPKSKSKIDKKDADVKVAVDK